MSGYAQIKSDSLHGGAVSAHAWDADSSLHEVDSSDAPTYKIETEEHRSTKSNKDDTDRQRGKKGGNESPLDSLFANDIQKMEGEAT